MKDPIQILMDEHRAIEKMIEVIERASEKLEKGEDVAPDDLEKMVTFIRTFADKCHHAKEEDILFPKMEEFGVPRDGGPIGVMLIEHEQGREHVRAMLEAIESYRKGDKKDAADKFVSNARSYANLLLQHINKEDNILYRIAEMHIPGEELVKMVDEFDRVEKERVGEGVHEQMHAILHELVEKYLG